MTRLTARARKKIPTKDFAGPDRSYPIENASHARNALSRVTQNGSPYLKAKVRSKVAKKFPGIKMKMDGGKVCQRADRSPRRK